MYFLKLNLLVFLLLVLSLTEARDLKKIVEITRELQLEVDRAYKDYKESCNLTSTNQAGDYERIVSDFLKQNFTLHDAPRLNPLINEPLKTANVTTEESFLTKLKRKLSDLVHGTVKQPETRIKRCLGPRDFDGAEITMETKVFNVTTSDIEDFENFMVKMIECLKDGEGDNQQSPAPDEASDPQADDHTSPPIHNHPFNASRIDNLLRYLTQAKHSVQDTGRPVHKSVDLQKIQTIVDQIKNFDFFNLEEATEKSLTAGDEPMDLLEGETAKRSSRNVLDDFSKKIKDFVGGKKKSKKLKSSRLETKQKRKSSGLFSNVEVNQKDLEPEQVIEDIEIQPAVVQVESTESERLQTDLNKFESKLSPEQQVEISDFLDHIGDKPKAFKFDISPYLLTQLEKLNHPSVDNQDNPEEAETFEGAKKFFDFNNAPVKRSLYNTEDFTKIAKLKSKLIAEYRDHHPVIDYAAILRKIDSDKHELDEKKDDFIDNFYQLNDGSSGLYDVLKPYHPEQRVMSPFELDLNFQLDNQFKELDTSHDGLIYKPENHLEPEDLSP